MMKLRMMRIVPITKEIIAFKCASPGRFIHLEKFGLINVAIPRNMIIIPIIKVMIDVIDVDEILF
jgi:hypothetical protein